MTIVSDSVNSATSNSYMGAGTTRWMSPELLDPEHLGFEDSRPTKPSDCYALGMVILEVLSDKPPFAGYNNFVVMQKVIRGEHPKIPGSDGEFWAAVRFADGGLRRTLEQCWSLQPMDRPAVKDVLACLEQIVISLNEPLELCSSDCIETLPMEYACAYLQFIVTLTLKRLCSVSERFSRFGPTNYYACASHCTCVRYFVQGGRLVSNTFPSRYIRERKAGNPLPKTLYQSQLPHGKLKTGWVIPSRGRKRPPNKH